MSAKFDYHGAKKAGYSDEEIMEHLSSRYPEYDVKSAKKSGYSPEEINQYLSTYEPKQKEDNRGLGERIKGAANQYGAGAAGGAGGIGSDILQLIKKSGLGGILGSKLIPENTGSGTDELSEKIAEEFDVNEPVDSLERILKESGKWGGQEATFGTALGGPLGGGAGLAHGSASGALYGGLKELGLDDEWALGLTGLATLSPLAVQKLLPKIEQKLAGKGKQTTTLKEPPPPPGPDNVKANSPFETTEIKRMSSGLAEPKAVTAENIHLATISPDRQKAAIEKLNSEASHLTQKSIDRHLPIAKKIEEGFDFEKQFEKNFGRLKHLAKSADPEIDIRPLNKLFSHYENEYRGIPTPHPEAKLIKQEIRNFKKNPQSSMYNLLKIYRSNNRKQRSLYETARLTGRQQEYSDFLAEMNRAISESFGKTLPEDSQWMKSFLNTNKVYKNYLDTKKTLAQLKPFLEGNITLAKVNRLALDTKMQKRLSLSMGNEGASEVIQIAQDLKKAIESIKKIPTHELKMWDAVFPVGMLMPFLGIQIPSALVSLHKGSKFARNLYGYWLSSPARRKAFDRAVKAIEHKNLSEYKEATKDLKKEMPNI
jgi:hypothetical protein